MEQEPKKEWVKPELNVINFTKTSENVLSFSIQQGPPPENGPNHQ
jgi:hypothetical protein